MKKYLVEALGTFALTFMVALSLVGSFPISTPVLAVLVVGLFVYAVGHISGSHINPAVTVGLWSIKKINGKETIKYFVAQFVGAGLAYFVFSLINKTGANIIFSSMSSTTIFFAESIGMFFYGFFIAAVAFDRIPHYLSGFIIAGALLMGITLAVLIGSAGFLHPAMALALGSFNPMYLVGPFLGSILGMQVYRYLDK